MEPIAAAREVRAPVEDVFRVCTDLERAPERISAITAVKVLSEGPFGVGTRWRETRVMYGREASEEMWVTEFEPGRKYVAEAESHGTHYRTEFTFEPTEPGTLLLISFGAVPVSFFARLMMPLMSFMAKGLRECLQQDLEDIARSVESGQA